MWPYVIGFIVILVLVAVVTGRRGSTGASRDDDLPSRYQQDGRKGTGFVDGGGGGGGW